MCQSTSNINFIRVVPDFVFHFQLRQIQNPAIFGNLAKSDSGQISGWIWRTPATIFSARQHAERAICYRPSVRPSHWWISRKRLKLGSCNFHRTVAQSLYFFQGKFHPEIRTGSPRAGASNKGGYVASCVQFNT